MVLVILKIFKGPLNMNTLLKKLFFSTVFFGIFIISSNTYAGSYCVKGYITSIEINQNDNKVFIEVNVTNSCTGTRTFVLGTDLNSATLKSKLAVAYSAFSNNTLLQFCYTAAWCGEPNSIIDMFRIQNHE